MDGVDPVCVQILKDAGHTVDEKPKMTKTELLSVIGEYHGLVVRSETQVTVRVCGVWPSTVRPTTPCPPSLFPWLGFGVESWTRAPTHTPRPRLNPPHCRSLGSPFQC